MTDLTLQQIDGEDWGDPATAPTGMVARCLRLRRTPLKDMTVGDVRLLISQKIGLERLIPRALQALTRAPSLETEFYPGDLLSALLRVDETYWLKNPIELKQLSVIARSVTPVENTLAEKRVIQECQIFLDSLEL